MQFYTRQVSVGTTPTEIVPARNVRVSCSVTNAGDADVYLGGASVSTSNGDLLAGGKGSAKSFTWLAEWGALYGVVASGTQTVTVMEIY